MRTLLLLLLFPTLVFADPDTFVIGRIDHPPINESSGIIASRKNPGVFWTHNDSGNAPVLYAITRTGTLLAEFPVTAINLDWEDIAADETGNLYIADTGNNARKRQDFRVLRIAEPKVELDAPSVRHAPERLRVDAQWTVPYLPNDSFDSEGFFIHDGFGYLISKNLDMNEARLYRFPINANQDALKLQYVTTLPIRTPVTGADLSPDGKLLAIATPLGPWLLEIDGPLADPLRLVQHKVTVLKSSMEAVCINGKELLATTEGREMLAFSFDQLGRNIQEPPPRVPVLSITHADKEPTLDADLAEWQDIAALHLRTPHRPTDTEPATQAWCQWNEKGIFIAGIIFDDKLTPLSDSWFAGDCVEVFIGNHAPNRPPEYTPGDDRCYIGFSKNADGTPGDLQLHWPRHRDNPPTGARAAGRINADGTWQFELFIPASVLSTDEKALTPLTKDQQIRLDLSFVSREPRRAWHLSTANSNGTWLSPWYWAIVQLN